MERISSIFSFTHVLQVVTNEENEIIIAIITN